MRTPLHTNYLKSRREIKKLMASIEKSLTKQDENFKKDSGNYGYLGNVNYVKSELENIDKFLNPTK
mgnify:CR=1 FL=1